MAFRIVFIGTVISLALMGCGVNSQTVFENNKECYELTDSIRSEYAFDDVDAYGKVIKIQYSPILDTCIAVIKKVAQTVPGDSFIVKDIINVFTGDLLERINGKGGYTCQYHPSDCENSIFKLEPEFESKIEELTKY